jgi:hypothetical protein
MLLEFGSITQPVGSESARSELADIVDRHGLAITRGVATAHEVASIKAYLANVGRASLPNWQALVPGCPNHHRVNNWDQRAHVRGCFHQFSFFPWNQDLFGFFARFSAVWQLRNLLAGAPADHFLGAEPQDGCIARLTVHHYPCGGGALNRHLDPVGSHQAAVPLMVMSQRGEDYAKGGLYLDAPDGTRTWLDDVAELGDVVWSHPQAPHGVEAIDPDKTIDWPAFRGRWSAIFAVNKVTNNMSIADAMESAQLS